MEIGPQSNPFKVFEQWMADARQNKSIREATAMSLGTLSPKGDVNVRVVLCKGWSGKGFVFYSNYLSRKGEDIAGHAQIGATFYWDPMFRQVKINGRAEKTSRAESEAYWASRPRDSQISQFISKQSQPVESRDALEKAWAKAEAEYSGKEIPCPSHWGGYVIIPERIEFWIGLPGRLHDRFEFEKTPSSWTFRRLCP